MVEKTSAKTQIEQLKQEIERLKKESSNKEWGLQKTNEAVKALYKDLEKKSEALKKLDRFKDDLMNTVSHELRTPLAISKEATSLVLDGISGPINDKQRKYLTTSHDNLIRLNTIIDDFLDVSKIEAGKVTLRRGLVDLCALLKNFTDDYQKVLSTKKQTLKTRLPNESIYLFIDGDKMIQVVTNLLNNAHKFAPEGGLIELDLEMCESNVLCRVKDNGMGIKEEDMLKLFSKFEQFGRTAGPGIKGTGLGLTISKALVELHDGEIWAESREGEGTTFFFTLPNNKRAQSDFDQRMGGIFKEACVKDAASFIILYFSNLDAIKKKYGEKTVVDIINEILGILGGILCRPLDKFFLYEFHTIYAILPETDREGGLSVINRIKEAGRECHLGLNDNSELELNFGLAVCPDEARERDGLVRVAFEKISKKKNLLIVDDHIQIYKILNARLANENFTIQAAQDGQEALDIIAQGRPDLIVLDIMMPKMNGYELLGRLKAGTETSSIPIIILTAKMTETVQREYKNLGNIPVVQKTGGFKELIQLVKKMI